MLSARLISVPLPLRLVFASVVLLTFLAVACGTESSTHAGEVAPEFSLPAANRTTDISLSDFRGEKDVVLIFYRGYF